MWGWGRGSGIGWGYSCHRIPCRYSALFIRACSNNCMAFSFCLLEGEETEKGSCCVARVGFELLPWIPSVHHHAWLSWVLKALIISQFPLLGCILLGFSEPRQPMQTVVTLFFHVKPTQEISRELHLKGVSPTCLAVWCPCGPRA